MKPPAFLLMSLLGYGGATLLESELHRITSDGSNLSSKWPELCENQDPWSSECLMVPWPLEQSFANLLWQNEVEQRSWNGRTHGSSSGACQQTSIEGTGEDDEVASLSRKSQKPMTPNNLRSFTALTAPASSVESDALRDKWFRSLTTAHPVGTQYPSACKTLLSPSSPPENSSHLGPQPVATRRDEPHGAKTDLFDSTNSPGADAGLPKISQLSVVAPSGVSPHSSLREPGFESPKIVGTSQGLAVGKHSTAPGTSELDWLSQKEDSSYMTKKLDIDFIKLDRWLQAEDESPVGAETTTSHAKGVGSENEGLAEKLQQTNFKLFLETSDAPWSLLQPDAILSHTNTDHTAELHVVEALGITRKRKYCEPGQNESARSNFAWLAEPMISSHKNAEGETLNFRQRQKDHISWPGSFPAYPNPATQGFDHRQSELPTHSPQLQYPSVMDWAQSSHELQELIFNLDNGPLENRESPNLHEAHQKTHNQSRLGVKPNLHVFSQAQGQKEKVFNMASSPPLDFRDNPDGFDSSSIDSIFVRARASKAMCPIKGDTIDFLQPKISKFIIAKYLKRPSSTNDEYSDAKDVSAFIYSLNLKLEDLLKRRNESSTRSIDSRSSLAFKFTTHWGLRVIRPYIFYLRPDWLRSRFVTNKAAFDSKCILNEVVYQNSIRACAQLGLMGELKSFLTKLFSLVRSSCIKRTNCTSLNTSSMVVLVIQRVVLRLLYHLILLHQIDNLSFSDLPMNFKNNLDDVFKMLQDFWLKFPFGRSKSQVPESNMFFKALNYKPLVFLKSFVCYQGTVSAENSIARLLLKEVLCEGKHFKNYKNLTGVTASLKVFIEDVSVVDWLSDFGRMTCKKNQDG